MSDLAVDASQPKPPLTPLTFVSIPLLISLVFDRYPFGTSMGRRLDLTCSSIDTVMRKSGFCTTRPSPGESCTLLCRHEVDRLTTTVLVTESIHSLAVSLLTAFYEVVNSNNWPSDLIGREQCEQNIWYGFLTQPAANKSTVKLALNQLGP